MPKYLQTLKKARMPTPFARRKKPNPRLSAPSELLSADSKQKYLNIFLPETPFSPRYKSQTTEERLAPKLQADLEKLWAARTESLSSVKTIFSSCVRVLPDGSAPIGQVFNKVLLDFEWKYRLMTNDPHKVVWGFNCLSDAFLAEKSAQELISPARSLARHLGFLARWGILVDPETIFVTHEKAFLGFAFDLFAELMDKKLIHERQSTLLFSFRLNRGVRPEEYRVLRERSLHQIIAFRVTSVGSHPLPGLPLEKAEVSFLVTVKEINALPLVSAISIGELTNYCVFEMSGKIFACKDEFVRAERFFWEKKTRVIAKLVGSQLSTWLLENPARPTEEVSLVASLSAPMSSGFVGLCPALYKEDLKIFEELDLVFEQGIGQDAKIIGGLANGLTFGQVEGFVKKELAGVLLEGFLISEFVEKYVSLTFEDRLFFVCQIDYFLSISEEIRANAIKNFSGMETSGPGQGLGFDSIENSLKRGAADIKITSSEITGIPIPLLRNSQFKGKIMTNPSIIQKYKEFFSEKTIFDFKETDSENFGPENLKHKRQWKKDSRVFSHDFLKIASFLYIKSDSNFSGGQNNARSQIFDLSDAQTDLSLNLPFANSNPKPRYIPSQYPFAFICEGIDQNSRFLAKSFLLQTLLSLELSPRNLKSHALLCDQEDQPLRTPSETVLKGVTVKSGGQAFGHSADCFRLYAAFVDLPKSPFTNLHFRSENLHDKTRELNAMRCIFWELLRLIGADFDRIDLIEQRQSLPFLEQLVLNQLKLFVEVTDKAFLEKNYNLVYAALFDFLKYFILDLYIPARKQLIITRPFSREAAAARNLMAKIVDATSAVMAPIIPFNAQDIHGCIVHRSRPESVFEEPWPAKELAFLPLNLDFVKDLETLRQIKEVAKNFFDKQKEMLLKKREENNKESFIGDVFDSRKFHVTISLDSSQNRENFELLQQKFVGFLEPLKEDLPFLLETTTANFIDRRINSNVRAPKEMRALLFVNEEKVGMKLSFSLIKGRFKCGRCFRFLKSSKKDNFCEECQRYVNQKFKL